MKEIFVKLNYETVLNIISLLKDVKQIHDVKEYNDECSSDCDACRSSKILFDIFNQMSKQDPSLLNKFSSGDDNV